jgi:hypothetical protein
MAKADLNSVNKSGSCRNGLAILRSSFDTIIAYSFQLNVTPYQKKPDISQLFVIRCVHKAAGRVTISRHICLSVHPSACNATSTGQNFGYFQIWDFYQYLTTHSHNEPIHEETNLYTVWPLMTIHSLQAEIYFKFDVTIRNLFKQAWRVDSNMANR